MNLRSTISVLFTAFFFLLISLSLAQETSSDRKAFDLNKAKLDSIKSQSRLKQRSEIENRGALLELEMYFRNKKHHDEYLECLSLLSSSYSQEGKWDSLLYYLNVGIVDIIRPKKTTYKELINIFYNRYAAALNDAGQYINSKKIYEEHLDYLRKNDTLGLARAYNNFAVLLNNLKENEQSLRYYDSCLTALKRSGLDTASHLAYAAYLNQAMPKMNMGQFQEALESLRKSEINLVNLNMQNNPGEVILISLYYAYVYAYKNEFPEDLELASKYAKKGYEMLYQINKDHFYMVYFYLIMGDIEEKKGNFSQSFDFNNKAVVLKTMLHGEFNDDMPSMLTILARISSKLGQQESTAGFFAKVDKFYARPDQLKTYDYIEYLLEDAEFRLKIKDLKLAEDKLLQALQGYIPSYAWRHGIADNPTIDLIPDNYQSAFFFIKKGEITKRIAEITNDTNLLNSSLDAYVLGILLLNKSKNAIFNIRSKSQYGQQKSVYFSEAIQLATSLYQKTNDNTYWEKAFLLADLNKSSNLKHHLNQKSNTFQKLIPSELQAKELELRTDINFLELQVYRDSFTKAIQSSSNDSTLQLIVKKKEEVNHLLTSYKTDFPNYYNLHYGGQNFNSKSIFDPNQTKALRNSKKLIIQYIEFENDILMIYLKGNNEGIFKIEKDQLFTSNLNKFISDSKNPKSQHFQPAAYFLYEKLIGPVLKVEPAEHIIIIPDGALNHINFEILISKPIEEQNAFDKFNYLLKTHSITYQYSSSLIDFKKASLKKSKGSFLGFAPYQGNEKPLFLAQSERNSNIDLASFTSLPYSELEVTALSGKFSGQGYIGNEAKESYLKSQGKNSNILHFATHSHIDKNNPLFSSLLLSADDNDDGILYTHELYEMNLNADLVTLSACNSGYGEHQQGEGVISLARGFMYANVSNVLMSLWAVSDQSTSKLMSSFYDNVYNGESYSDAIRNAKLEYLQHADENTAHPYYWAGFVYLGNVEAAKPNYILYLFFAGLSMLIVFLVWRRFLRHI
ncbi:CHAT domain-containing protein [Belliella sp. DSM 111904]|uniref:CHAT domain-containing protein n=1 Tax=Belliella filtrata TaxID=2923435 RepID=A0ABS9UZ91_9BACT|nr:CHAT domain-containing tetratricopeptide repeat protein [Belliella filtrata]MCH7409477.1 CHAT domain-containing protein [Belliella filtrata]